MIKISGVAKFSLNYEVTLNMTEEEFDSLSCQKQTEEIENAVDWYYEMRNADIDEIEVDDLEEV